MDELDLRGGVGLDLLILVEAMVLAAMIEGDEAMIGQQLCKKWRCGDEAIMVPINGEEHHSTRLTV
jgi:hypothetical protein